MLSHDVALSAVKSIGIAGARSIGDGWVPVKINLEMRCLRDG